MVKGLIIVESPNKVKSIQKYVGSNYIVAASVGHITALGQTRDDRLGFEVLPNGVEVDFVPNGDRGKSVIAKLRGLAKKCDEIILASDPDREGEAIAWHCAEQVGAGKKISRITYTEITKEAVLAALQNRRGIDLDLVHAQFGRQLLDKWIGYKFSGLLIRDTDGEARSVGRVQSAALGILCELENKITTFKPHPYWSLSAKYQEGFVARFLDEDGAEDAIEGSEVSDDQQIDDTGEGQEVSSGKRVLSEPEAKRLVAIAKGSAHTVLEFKGRESKSKPPAALTTSSLQQLAGSRLGFSTDKTMKVAQKLFEGMDLPNGKTGGVITYHRTDSVTLSDEFCDAARGWLQANHPELVPANVTKHKTKGNAQGAHEAIRPTDVALTPEVMKGTLNADQMALYTLIWQRAIASQCAPAILDKTRVVIQAGSTRWECRGSVLKSPGYTKIFNNMGGDSVLPVLAEGSTLTPQDVSYSEKKTTPPGRLSEPQLVAKMEKLGVGRPSTYASIMATLRQRNYVSDVGKGKKQKLQPTGLGMTCYQWLKAEFDLLLNTRFTAQMESTLDDIASGERDWEKYLLEFGQTVVTPAVEKISKRLKSKPPSGQTEFTCLACGTKMVKRSYKKKGGGSGVILICPNDKDRQHPAFFQVKGGKFWNPKYGDARTDILSDALPDLAQLEKEYAEQEEKRKPSGEKTPYICTDCESPLLKFSYQKDGVQKYRLGCSNDSNHPVYFWTKRKNWWNPDDIPLLDKNGPAEQPNSSYVAGNGAAQKKSIRKKSGNKKKTKASV